MSLSEREQRLKFLGLTVRNADLLKALRPLFEQKVIAIVDAFYDQLLSFPETEQLLRDHTTVERLKKLQRDYLVRITEGNFDEAYFADRLRIGKTHERVGLSPRWYLLGYSIYLRLFVPLIREFYANDSSRSYESIIALEKAFMLDASIAMDAYIASDRYRRLQQLESIVNDSADMIFSLDNANRFRSWNQAAERVFGWGAEEILGKPFTLIVPPELVQAGEMDRIDKQIHEQGHYNLETVRLSKDGRRVPVEVSVSVLRDPQGQPIGRSAILRDITERKRLEEEKIRAERLAVIGAMSARLAHEIRNPLSSITLNIDLVRDEVDTLSQDKTAAANEARSLLQSIDSEVRRIERVTEDYLQFARMPRPRRELTSLNEILAQGLTFMESLFKATNVEVRTEFDAALPRVEADEGQLWQAILNLVRNALEAMPSGGTLLVSTAQCWPNVILTVRDTGRGMTEPERQQLFKPFFSTKPSGTGLGLPLTQQIIAEHGGNIRCESAPNKGTTFLIELPLPEGSRYAKKS
ncbi:MAG TPA: protoglobin domain-containing protein [Verrucomicrobiae bacterium]|nr:protoglobin domain-containing protein [Verrucomicrobiae bacterium]